MILEQKQIESIPYAYVVGSLMLENTLAKVQEGGELNL